MESRFFIFLIASMQVRFACSVVKIVCVFAVPSQIRPVVIILILLITVDLCIVNSCRVTNWVNIVGIQTRDCWIFCCIFVEIICILAESSDFLEVVPFL